MKKTNPFYLVPLYILLLCSACKQSDKRSMSATEEKPAKDVAQRLPAMSETEIDAERQNIDRISDWKDIRNVDLNDSNARGKANFYFIDGKLVKLVTKYFGTLNQNVRHYYAKNGQLLMAVEEKVNYNRPIFYDTTLMRIEEDTVAFDLKKSDYKKTTFYFNNEKAIKIIIDSIPLFDPASESAHSAQILADFNRIKALSKK